MSLLDSVHRPKPVKSIGLSESNTMKYNIDDPKNLSQFFTRSGAGQSKEDNPHVTQIATRAKQAENHKLNGEAQSFASPATVQDESQSPDGFAERSIGNNTRVNQHSSPSSHVQNVRIPGPFSPNKLDFETPKPELTSVQIELLQKKTKHASNTQTYQDDVVANWRTSPRVVNRVDSIRVESDNTDQAKSVHDSSKEMPVESEALTNIPEESTIISEAPKVSDSPNMMSSQVAVVSPPSSLPEVSEPFPSAMSAITTPMKQNSNIDDKELECRVEDNGTSEILQDASSVLADKIAKVVINQAKEDAAVIFAVPASDIAKDGQDRRNATHFATWGSPQVRNKPTSQVRKVILSGLPPLSSLTLVQSLVHGGAIDTMTMNTTGTTAFVTFTTGEACNAYFNEYPNGLVYKVRGKSHTVFINKGKDVDVVSGVLEGHLAAGASRAVKVVDADEDWTMRALQKVAEGAKGSRNVESIDDSFRAEVRTIIFRFASVADAVMFRGILQRDPDWNYCDISFATDPCEKATTIHFD